MRKYQTEFKLKEVKTFFMGTAERSYWPGKWSVPEEKIRAWVNLYRLHGIDGLRPERSK